VHHKCFFKPLIVYFFELTIHAECFEAIALRDWRARKARGRSSAEGLFYQRHALVHQAGIVRRVSGERP
jgi:hypothetical protein